MQLLKARRVRLVALAGLALLVSTGRAFSQETPKTGEKPAEKPAERVPTDKTLMWKATSDAGEVYLLGSIHLATEELYPMAPEIEDAFKRSKSLVVEADPEKVDGEKIQKLVAEKGKYAEGDSISKHLSEKGLDSLKKTLEKLGLPFDQVESYKPWLLSISLAQALYGKAGLDPQHGVDVHFLKKAKKKGKEILELESIEQQLDMFASLDDSSMEASMTNDVDELDKATDLVKQLVPAWTDGDTKLIQDKLIDEPRKKAGEKGKAYFEKLLDERNVKMVEKIEGYLKEKGPYFVVVGAAHLVGEKGIVKLLEDKKYKVEPVKKAIKAKDKDEKKDGENGEKKPGEGK